ncbi:hypothetical protein H0R94_04725 [Treponema socranskii]|uniref:hypothetical protein n=1 Tax=Treponema socranskii TaxID=53419 RepID=UPI003D8B211D
MKKMMIGMMLIAALGLFAGCSNGASGSDDGGEVDYAARLLGTWYTPGYDADQYISVTDTTPPPLTYEYKAKLTFTRTEIISEGSFRNSSDTSLVKNGTRTVIHKIIAITATYFQEKKDSAKTDYEILPNGKLRFAHSDYFIYEKK